MKNQLRVKEVMLDLMDEFGMDTGNISKIPLKSTVTLINSNLKSILPRQIFVACQ